MRRDSWYRAERISQRLSTSIVQQSVRNRRSGFQRRGDRDRQIRRSSGAVYRLAHCLWGPSSRREFLVETDSKLLLCSITIHRPTLTCVHLHVYAHKLALSAFVRRGCSNRSISPARRPGPQQHNCNSRFAAVGPCWDKQTDRQADGHRTVSYRFAYYVGDSANNECASYKDTDSESQFTICTWLNIVKINDGPRPLAPWWTCTGMRLLFPLDNPALVAIKGGFRRGRTGWSPSPLSACRGIWQKIIMPKTGGSVGYHISKTVHLRVIRFRPPFPGVSSLNPTW